MKRALTTLLAAGLLVFLAACGGNGSDNAPTGGGNNPPTVQETPQPTQEPTPDPTPEPQPEIQILEVGEAAANEDVEVVLLSYEFDTSVRVGSSNIRASDGNANIAVVFSVTNVGRTELGRLSGFGGFLSVFADYNDGFVFESSERRNYSRDNETWSSTVPAPMQPLAQTQYFSTYVSVPLQAMENTDLPLLIGIHLQVAMCFTIE